MTGRVHLGVLATHPSQYMAPLLRRLAREPDLDLTAFFGCRVSESGFHDSGFGRRIVWDVSLTEGYRCESLPGWGREGEPSMWRPINWGLASRLRRSGVTHLLVHGYGRPNHLAAVAAARRAGVRVLIRDEANALSRRRGPLKRALKRMFFGGLDRMVDGFLAIGSRNRDYYLAQGIAASRVGLMPYAVDNAYFQTHSAGAGDAARREFGLPAEAPVVLYASKFQQRKHPDHLIEAFLGLPPDLGAHLVMVGDGEMAESLRRTAAGRPDIHFLGFRNQGELPALYAMCDVFVLPSSCEPWGLVVNEAMACGRAVIVGDQVGCVPDLVRSGENGFVFPSGDVGALRRALAVVCGDRGRAAAMGRNSRDIVRRWDFEADVEGLRRILESTPQEAVR